MNELTLNISAKFVDGDGDTYSATCDTISKMLEIEINESTTFSLNIEDVDTFCEMLLVAAHASSGT